MKEKYLTPPGRNLKEKEYPNSNIEDIFYTYIMTNKQLHGASFQATCSGTTGIITISGAINQIIYITDISGSTDLATGTMIIQSGSANGTTTIWQDFVRNTVPYQLSLQNPIQGNSGDSVTITFSKTSTAYANVSGFKITS